MAIKRPTAAAKALAYLSKYPDASAKEVATKHNLSVPYVYSLKARVRKAESARVHPQVETPLVIEMVEPQPDPVNHPAHYTVGGIETIDFIEAKKLNYRLGNAVKYIARSEYKGNRRQDIEKAIWYLKRELQVMEGTA